MRNQRRQQDLQYGIFLLCMQIIKFGLDKIPPATLIVVIVQVILTINYCVFNLEVIRTIICVQHQLNNTSFSNITCIICGKIIFFKMHIFTTTFLFCTSIYIYIYISYFEL